MAEVSYLHPQDDDDDEDRDDLVEALDSLPYWSHHDFDDTFDLFDSDPDFHPITSVRVDEVSNPDSISAVDLFDRENQVNFVMDLFHQRVDQSSSTRGESNLASPEPDPDLNFGFVEGNDEMGSTHLELDLGLGLGSGFCDDGDDDVNFGFGVGVRVGSDSEEDDENEVVGLGLNVEDDCVLENNVCDDDTSLQLCWDSFQLEDNREGDEEENFEWEEVDGRVDEREVLSMFFDADMDEDLDVSVSVSGIEEMGVGERVGGTRNLEWEVLLNVHDLETNLHLGNDGERYLGDQDNYTVEYETLFGQFVENENALVGGRPPASKTVVENLESVILIQEDVENDNALCAVCKDGMCVGEQAKKLPCSHWYHGDCIVPWLGIRNTCPACRYELPTDDPEYERRRNQRAGRLQ